MKGPAQGSTPSPPGSRRYVASIVEDDRVFALAWLEQVAGRCPAVGPRIEELGTGEHTTLVSFGAVALLSRDRSTLS